MQRTDLDSRHCSYCGRLTKHERHVTPAGGGDFILALLTVGLWMIVRRVFQPPFRCSVCGSK